MRTLKYITQVDSDYLNLQVDHIKPYLRVLIAEMIFVSFYNSVLNDYGNLAFGLCLIAYCFLILALWKCLSRRHFEIAYLFGCILTHYYALWTRTQMEYSAPLITSTLRGNTLGLVEASIIFTQPRILFSTIACFMITGFKLYLGCDFAWSINFFTVLSSIGVLIIRVAIEIGKRKMYHDMLDKNESLKKFKTLIEMHLPSGMLIMDRALKKPLFSNNHFNSIFCCQKECSVSILEKIICEESLKPLSKFPHIDPKNNKKSLNDFILATFNEGASKISKKVSCNYHLNDSRRFFEATIFSFIWEGEEAVVLFLTEITPQVENAELISLNYTKELAISTIAHELRNPLSGILGLAQIISTKSKEPKVKEKLHTMSTIASYLLNLLNSILDLQQIKNQKLTLNYTLFPLREVTDVLLNIFEFQTREKKIFFKLELDVDPNIKIFSDKDRLAQILINLCANAIKFTFQGGVTLKVKPVDRYNIEFIVSDTGVGMKPEEMNKLFSAFGKLESTSNINKHGVGLGLLISNSLVKIFNQNKPDNSIQVESQEGIGSKFSFMLDIGDYQYCLDASSDVIVDFLDDSIETVGIQEYSPSLKSKISFKEKSCKMETIIIADDNPFNLVAFKQIIGESRYNIKTAMNGQEVVDLVLTSPQNVVVIFMDCEMPIMNGIEATMVLKTKMKQGLIPSIKIVGISGYDDEKIMREWKEKGLDCFLVKPIMKSKIDELIPDLYHGEQILN